MARSKPSRLEFRPGYREPSRCSYWDYYVDGRRLADLLDVGDFIPPLGWLAPEVEAVFASMLLRKRESNFKLGRVPLFVCPECADYGCSVFTCSISRSGDFIEWRDFAREQDDDDQLRQSDAERNTRYVFPATEYFHAFDPFRPSSRTGKSRPSTPSETKKER